MANFLAEGGSREDKGQNHMWGLPCKSSSSELHGQDSREEKTDPLEILVQRTQAASLDPVCEFKVIVSEIIYSTQHVMA